MCDPAGPQHSEVTQKGHSASFDPLAWWCKCGREITVRDDGRLPLHTAGSVHGYTLCAESSRLVITSGLDRHGGATAASGPKAALERATRHVRAAQRIRSALSDAEAGNYLKHGWYNHIHISDLEAVLEFVEAAVGQLRKDPGRCICNFPTIYNSPEGARGHMDPDCPVHRRRG